MSQQKMLQDNMEFNAIRKTLIAKSDYFPKITMIQYVNTHYLCTIVRKKQDGIWYKFPVINAFTDQGKGIENTGIMPIIIRFIDEAYKAMILTQISDNIVDYQGNPIFVKDDLQWDEEQRIIMETKVLRNNILTHD